MRKLEAVKKLEAVIPPDPLIVKGWKFSICKKDPYEVIRAVTQITLLHISSGVEFRFSAIDAIHKWKDELDIQIPTHSRFPTYDSPFPPSHFDSAYVGKVFTTKSPHIEECSPEWENIDLEILPELVDRSISYVPESSFPRDRFYRKYSGLDGLPFNYMVPVYYGSCEDTDYSCEFHLVVTDVVWFVSLSQQVVNGDGTSRVREMNMHCYFDEDIVYREIIERQSMFYNEKLPKVNVWKQKTYYERRCDQDDEMRVHFHEAKQLRIQGVFALTSGLQRYSDSCTFRKLKASCLGIVDVSDEKIKLITADCCGMIKSIEAKTGTHIQIIPLFRHPYYPKEARKRTAKVYIDGLENNIEHAKSCFRKLLRVDRTEQLCNLDCDLEANCDSSSESELGWEIDSGESESEELENDTVRWEVDSGESEGETEGFEKESKTVEERGLDDLIVSLAETYTKRRPSGYDYLQQMQQL